MAALILLCFMQLSFTHAVLAQTLGSPTATDTAQSEREYVRRPPLAIPRPGPCRPELQASIRLSGTVYDAHNPDRSLAIMGAQTTRKMAVYRCGARVGTYEILAVRPRAVLLSTDTDDPCWLPLTRPTSTTPPPRATAPAPKKQRRSRTAFTSDELEQSIHQLQPGVYRVERSLLDRALTRAGKIARTTRTRTVQAHGSPVGLRLTRIASGGLFEHLGLKRGDVLKTVNGFQVASVDGMLSARTKLATAPRLSVAVVRDGKPITLEYRMH
jgi:type II secretory pathway component PulC